MLSINVDQVNKSAGKGDERHPSDKYDQTAIGKKRDETTQKIPSFALEGDKNIRKRKNHGHATHSKSCLPISRTRSTGNEQ